MNWITTNIRIPEEDYMEIKLEAAHTRKSVASIIRDRISKKTKKDEVSTEKLMADMEKFAKKMARVNKGINLSEAVIKMRYEQ